MKAIATCDFLHDGVNYSKGEVVAINDVQIMALHIVALVDVVNDDYIEPESTTQAETVPEPDATTVPKPDSPVVDETNAEPESTTQAETVATIKRTRKK